MTDYRVVGERSRIDISGRSSLHDIHGRARPDAVSGTLTATLDNGTLDLSSPPSGTVEVRVEGLAFGNAMYDRELPKRLDTRRHPTAAVTLAKIESDGAGAYRAGLTLTLHGISRDFEETVQVEQDSDGTLVVSGEHRFDIRDFGIEPPRMLGLRVHPDITVRATVVAVPADR